MAARAAADTRHSTPERARAACEDFVPLVVFPRTPRRLEAAAPELRGVIQRYLPRAGAILFRGFPVSEDQHFERFVACASDAEASALPRGARVWAWCVLPRAGQRVLLADRRELYRAVPENVRRRWAERGLVYVQRGEGGRLLLSRALCPVARHPRTHEALWAQPEHAARAGAFGALRGLAPGAGDDRPFGGGDAASWRVTHADGSPLAERDVHDVNAAVDACRSELCFEVRDVLLLEPALVAYAAAPGAGAGIALRHEPEQP